MNKYTIRQYFNIVFVLIAFLFLLSISIPYYLGQSYKFLSLLIGISIVVYLFVNKPIVVDSIFIYGFGFFILWLALSLLSYGWANSKSRVLLYSLRNINYVLIFFLLSQFLTNKRNFKFLRIFFTGFTVFLIIIAFWELFTWNHLPLSRFVKKDILTFKSTTIFTNENDFAAALLMYIPIAFYYLKKNIHVVFRILINFMMVVIFFFFVINGARLAIIGFAIFLAYHWIFHTKSKTKITSLFIILALFLVFLLIFSNYFQLFYEYLRFELETLQTDQTRVFMSSTDIRIALIKKSIELCKKSYLMGVGSGNYEAYMNYHSKILTGGSFNPHNLFFEILANNGLIIFFLFTVLIFYSFRDYIYSFIKTKNYLYYHYASMIFTFLLASTLPSSISGYFYFWMYLSYFILGLREKQFEEK